MKRPNSLRLYLILRASQALGDHYFSLGFHYFYTQFYTQFQQRFCYILVIQYRIRDSLRVRMAGDIFITE